MGALTQFWLLTWKSLCGMRRNKVWTTVEIACPAIFLICNLYVADVLQAAPDHPQGTNRTQPAFVSAKKKCPSSPVLFCSRDKLVNKSSIEWDTGIKLKEVSNEDEMEKMLRDALRKHTIEYDRTANETLCPEYQGGISVTFYNPKFKQLSYKLLLLKNTMVPFEVKTIANPFEYSQIMSDSYSLYKTFTDMKLFRFMTTIAKVAAKGLLNGTSLPEESEIEDRNFRVTFHSLPWPNRTPTSEAVLVTMTYMAMVMVTLLATMHTTREIASEKESGMKDYLMVMGMNRIVFFSSHIAMSFAKTIVAIVMNAVPLFLYVKVDPLLTLLSLLSFSLAMISIAALIAVLMKNAGTATIGILCTICGLLYVSYKHLDREDIVASYFLSLNPLASLLMFFETISERVIRNQDFGIEDAFAEAKYAFCAGSCMLMLLFDAFLYCSLAVFFDWFLCSSDSPFNKVKMCLMKSNDSDAKKSEREDIKGANEVDDLLKKGAVADIQVKNVVKQYHFGAPKCVNGLNMTCYRGQVTALLGHNGAGKSTTFGMLSGLTRPTSGEILIMGVDIAKHLGKCQKIIGYCPQGNVLFPNLTVYEHLEFFARLRNVPKQEWMKERKELCNLLKLETHANKVSSGLSGGMKRKLCVGIAMIGCNKVILLDEPTAGMDPGARRDIEHLLAKEKGRRTILLTTHYTDEAEMLGDRVVIMGHGKVVCSGTPQFLKRRFGMGYILTLATVAGKVSTASKSVKKIVDSHVKGATISDVHGQQIEINIPREQARKFARMFQDLENAKESLGIVSFGLALNNLEQVFLKVGELQSRKKINQYEKKVTADAMREVVERRGGDAIQKASGNALRQFFALMKKRFLYTIQYPVSFAMQLVIPIIVIFVGGSLIKDLSRTKLNLSVNMDLSLFGYMQIALFKNMENKTATEAFLKYYPQVELLDLEGDILEDEVFTKRALQRPPLFGAFGRDENGDHIIAYNDIYPLSPPMLLNEFLKVHYNYSIAVTLQDISDKEAENITGLYVKALPMGPLILLVCVLLITPLVKFPIADRTSNFAHQQRLTGVSPIIFWSANVFFDLLLFTVCMLINYECMVLYGILTHASFVPLSVTLLCYFASFIFVIYTVSFCVNSPSKAQCLLIFLQLTVTLILIVFVTLSNLKLIKVSLKTMDIFCFIASFILPPFALAMSGIFTAYSEAVEQLAEIEAQKYLRNGTGVPSRRILIREHLVSKKVSNRSLMFYMEDLVVSWNNCGRLWVIMLCFGVVSAALFVALQFKSFRRFFFRKWSNVRYEKYRDYASPTEMIAVQDSQVLEAREDIENKPKDSALVVDGLSKWYGQYCAVNKLSFAVHKRECFGLLGVNGAGKTSTFNVITGQTFATYGTVSVGDVDVAKNVAIGYCPQFDALLPELTGRQSLEILATLHGYTDVFKKVTSVLRVIGMHEHAHKKVSQYSGGQRRKLSVGVAILAYKSLIILDEPTAGIDPAARRDIWQLLMSIRDRTDTALLLTSHSMDECEALCSRIGVLRRGRMIALGNSQTLKTKFGRSYTLTLVVLPSINSNAVVERTKQIFPAAQVSSGLGTQTIVFMIPRKPTDKWSIMFSKAVQLADILKAQDFCLSQASLEQAFIFLCAQVGT